MSRVVSPVSGGAGVRQRPVRRQRSGEACALRGAGKRPPGTTTRGPAAIPSHGEAAAVAGTKEEPKRMDYLLALATDPAAWAALVTLTAMEVVLGIDNLIFISILTNKLPEHQRERARQVGLVGSGG